MKQEYYEEEMMVKEAITSQKSDQEIGMPDIEAELKKVKQLTTTTRMASLPIKGEVVNDRRGASWRRIAAVITLALSITGLAWAFIYYQNQKPANTITAEKLLQDDKTSVAEQEDTVVVKASKVLTLSYEKASLEQIVVDLTAYYHLEKPLFDNREAARKCKMHVTINKEASVQDAIGLLNQFGNIRIDLVENKLVVK